MNKAICSIYDKRPDICRKFPVNEKQIEAFKSCGYYFKDGERFGECNGCGECCINMPWPDDATLLSCDAFRTDKTELGGTPTEAVCRFLIEK